MQSRLGNRFVETPERDRLDRTAGAWLPWRQPLGAIINYLRRLSKGRLVLWCYLIWYLVVLVRYFDPNPQLWLTSVGLSLIIGIALVISASSSSRGTMALDRWQIFRLFLMPFCVSSFAALVKGKGFVLIFSPDAREIVAGLALCAVLWGVVTAIQRTPAPVPVPQAKPPAQDQAAPE
jgi:hypothetical protein